MIKGWAPTAVAAMALAVAISPAARAENANALVTLVDAAAARLQTADPIAAYKWVNGVAIDDQVRVRQVLDTVTADARAHAIDPDYVRRAFSDQIDATDAIEYTRFAQWKLDRASAPAAAPELSASRSTIDVLNKQMVGEMAANWSLLQSSVCDAALDDATDIVTTARGLDSLYQQALSLATRSYCR
jgi:chorismate mutase